MYLDIDTMFEHSKMLFEYLTTYRGYNAFLIDEIDGAKVKKLKEYIDANDRINAVRLFIQLANEADLIRSEYCYNHADRPYKSNFRQIAKDLYRELKESWILYDKELSYVAYLLRWISTSSYHQIKEFLIKRSRTMYLYKGIPLDGESFYCDYIPLEAIMDYCVKVSCYYIRNINKDE